MWTKKVFTDVFNQIKPDEEEWITESILRTQTPVGKVLFTVIQHTD